MDWIGLDWIGLDWIGLDWIDNVEAGVAEERYKDIFRNLVLLFNSKYHVAPEINFARRFVSSHWNHCVCKFLVSIGQ